ncbi:rplA family protein [Pseudomonas savastanoi pv. retacarpa]|nr:rplA family protein [Pseudomonas savastanoi pv. retacarpa]
MGTLFWMLGVQSGARGATAICDAERHQRHANAEHWHDSVLA